MRQGAIPVLHVCDKFGVAGSSIHGVSRLFSWWFPRYGARFAPSLVGLKHPEPATRWLGEQGIPVLSLGRGRFDPRILGDLVRVGQGAARAHPARARLRGRRFRPPGRAAAGGGARPPRALRGSAHARLPGTGRSRAVVPDRSRDRGQRLHARLPGARAPRARRARADHLERRAPRRVRARVAGRGAGHAAIAGDRGGRAGRRDHRPPQRAEGPPLSGRGRAGAPRVASRRAPPHRRRRRPHGAAEGAGDRPRCRVPHHFRRPSQDVRALLGALDVFCISSTYEGTPLALFEAMAAGRAIVSTAVDGCREVLEDGVTGLLVPRAIRPPSPPPSAACWTIAAPAEVPRRKCPRGLDPLRYPGVRGRHGNVVRRGAGRTRPRLRPRCR